MSTPETEKSNTQDVNKATTSTLGLGIPEQKNPPTDHVLLDSKKMAEWFRQLPVANIGETARQVYLNLVDFNRFDITEIARAKAVEQFRDPVEYVIDSLLKRYVDMGFPLSNKNWRITQLTRELCSELTIAYKIIVEHILSGDKAKFDRKLLIIAMHRSLYYLQRQITLSTLSYTPWPPGLWKEINALYTFARHNHVHKTPVRLGGKKKNKAATTIEDIYIAICLHAAMSPHQLKQTSISKIVPYLTSWASHCQIDDYLDETAPESQFILPVRQERPPIHAILGQETLKSGQLVLDARMLCGLLQREHEGEKNITEGLSNELVHHVYTTWQAPPARHSPRKSLVFEVKVLAGFNQLFDYLYDPESQVFELPEEPSDKKEKRRVMTASTVDTGLGGGLSLTMDDDGGSLLGGSSSTANDLSSRADSLLSGSGLVLEGDMGDEPVVFSSARPQSRATDEIQLIQVKTRNESEDGYCINWVGEDIPTLKITDILGIQSANADESFSPAAVRWVKYSDQNSIDIGVQILAINCEAAEISTHKELKANSEYRTDCLLLKGHVRSGETDRNRILMAGGDCQVGNQHVLIHKKQLIDIKICKILESHQGFRLCEYEKVDPAPVQTEPEEENKEKNTAEDFSDLWNNL